MIGADVWIDGQKPEGEMASDIGFDEILIENNYVKNVAKEGIRSSGQSTGAEGVGFRNTKTFRNITFRGNYIEEIFGDGIVLAEVGENGLVENNVVKNHCNYDTANYAGAWLWQCDDSVFRYNEVFGGEYGYNDGEAFDYDIGCKDIIYEYNYSHHNKGGLLLTMYDNASYHFRYNISANDGKPSQELFHCQTGETKIYNNTMYIGKGITTSIFQTGSVGYFKNNIIMAHGSVPKFGTSAISVSKGAMTNNIIYPASITSVNGPSEAVLEDNLFVNPRLSSPQMSTKYNSKEYDLTYENMGQGEDFIAGLRKRMAIFKLQENSPAVDAGVVIPESNAKEDIFGNAIVGLPDIGAHEFNNDPGPVEEDTEKAEKVILDKTELYMTVEDSVQLKASVQPEDILDDSIAWSVQDPDVVSVSAAGKVTARMKGETVITAVSLSNPEAKAECIVHVYEKDSASVIADKDARVRDDGTHSGTEESMTVKLDGSGYSRNVLMSFDLSSVPISYKRILLKFHIDSTEADNVPFTISRIGDEWEEESVTWSSMPDKGEKILDFSSSISDGGTWKELDITDYVETLLNSGEKRLSIVFEGVKVGSKNYTNIHSRETDYKPQLVFDNETVKSAEDIFVKVPVGTAPALPETVKVTYSDNTTADAAVVWDEIPAVKYEKEGQFTVCGYIEERKLPVIAYVTVSNSIITAVSAEDVTTRAGVAPILPETVNATYINGSEEQIPVVWEPVNESQYAKPGTFTVKGKVNGFDAGCIIKIIVTEAGVVEAEAVDITGYVGFMPVLPETVTVRYTDGSKGTARVAWEETEEEKYQKAGAFTVYGTCEGLEQKAAANVTMIDAAVKPAEMKSPAGKYPALPYTIKLENRSRAANASEVPVVWETVSRELYQGSNPYVVNGYIAGTTIPASIKITPADPLEYMDGVIDTNGDTYIQVSPSDGNHGNKDVIRIKNYDCLLYTSPSPRD